MRPGLQRNGHSVRMEGVTFVFHGGYVSCPSGKLGLRCWCSLGKWQLGLCLEDQTGIILGCRVQLELCWGLDQWWQRKTWREGWLQPFLGVCLCWGAAGRVTGLQRKTSLGNASLLLYCRAQKSINIYRLPALSESWFIFILFLFWEGCRKKAKSITPNE